MKQLYYAYMLLENEVLRREYRPDKNAKECNINLYLSGWYKWAWNHGA